MEAFRTFLTDFLEVSDHDWNIVSQKLVVRECEKNTVLTSDAVVEENLYFLISGAVRLFVELEDKEVTINFGFPNNFISSYSSFLTGNTSFFNLIALTSCQYIVIHKADLNWLYENTSFGQKLGRVLTERIFLYLSRRENAFLLKTPTERYLDLFDEQPQLIQEIPQKYLASYIGITPQALSRIRAKLAQTN